LGLFLERKVKKHLLYSINLKPFLRIKMVATSKSFTVIEEESTQVENLKNIAKMKAFRRNI